MAWHGSNRHQRLPGDWAKRRTRTLRRDGHLCQIHGPNCTRLATEVDHITAGDNHHLTNLQAVCSSCHAAKSAAEGVAAQAAIAAKGKRPTEPHPGLL